MPSELRSYIPPPAKQRQFVVIPPDTLDARIQAFIQSAQSRSAQCSDAETDDESVAASPTFTWNP